MADATTLDKIGLSVTVSTQVKQRLAQLASDAGRSEEELVSEAIESYLASYVELDDAQAELIRQRVAQADAGGPFIAHEDVARWIASRGTDHELPRPKATIVKEPRRK